ncbi:MAG: CapA family protein [Omnitrophica WOR_2 bacterium]
MTPPPRISRLISFLLVSVLFLTACQAQGLPLASPSMLPTEPASESTSINFTLLTPTASPTPQPTPTPVPSLWIEPYLSAALREAVTLPDGWQMAVQASEATMHLKVGDGHAVSHWIYALVAPFPTVTDGVKFEDVLRTWKGAPSGPFSGQPLLMDEDTRQVLTALWNAPADQAIKVVPATDLVETAWDSRPSWAIVPFEELEPRWKVLEVDGQSPLHKDFDPQTYPLVAPISIDTEPAQAGTTTQWINTLPATNRDPDKLTTLVMTGVTALVRGTSNLMYYYGADYPAKDIGDWLRSADITHISNEVPFAKLCPKYNETQADLRFCTNPEYIKLLEDIGTDVVELTGDHFIDQGPEATLFTLDLYKQHNWLYYGGGANINEARQAITLTDHGNKIAFIGCNAKRGGYATASETYPGAAPCDLDYMRTQIAKLKSEGYLVIATFQHQEYYTYQVKPDYRPDFTSMAEAGAVIVQGSQAHLPQNLEFDAGGLIHYGLGNLFFDQYLEGFPERQAFIDRHVIYEGRYISTELLTIMFVDLAHARPMTPEERQDLLTTIFKASGWQK